MLASGFLLGIIAGALARGDVRRLAALRLQAIPLLVVAVVLRVATPLAPAPLFFVSLVLVGAVAIANRGLPGVWLIALGSLLNALVVALNGAMPVDAAAAALVGSAGAHDAAHVVLGPETRLALLADVVPVPLVRSVYSPGDFLSAAGGFWLVFRGMRGW